MPFVFYDTETTGISTDYDQILQFAAIKTDDNLNVMDRYEVRCRLHPHVVPHPSALQVTGMTIDQLIDPSLPTHYEMIRLIHAKLMEWSPAMFIGYNSIKFDEHLLRQALFRTLHAPYLTNTGGNCRADALTLVQSAIEFSPGCLNVPLGKNGKTTFKLDALAPSNGFPHLNAHDALADVEATIHIVRCVRDAAPESWSRFLHFSTKTASLKFLGSQDAFVLTEFYFNRPYHFFLSAVGPSPSNSSAIAAFNLNFDPKVAALMSDEELRVWLASGEKPLRQVRVNAGPCLSTIDDVPPNLRGQFCRDTIESRAARLRDDHALRARILASLAAIAPAIETSEHVEEQIYAGFPSNADQVLMGRFHAVDWPERAGIVERFSDERLRYHGRRLIFEEQPDLLPEKVRYEVEAQIWERLLMRDVPRGKWTSIPDAIASAQDLTKRGNEDCSAMLKGFITYFADKIATRH